MDLVIGVSQSSNSPLPLATPRLTAAIFELLQYVNIIYMFKIFANCNVPLIDNTVLENRLIIQSLL